MISISATQRPDGAVLFDQIRKCKERERAAAPPPGIPPRPADLVRLPLSFAQERLWFIDHLRPELAAYNITQALLVRGEASPAVLAALLGEIVRRHEVLRTTFREADGRPVQVIAPAFRWRLPLVDLSALPAVARGAQSQLLAQNEAARPFDLAAGPLVRATLLRLAPDEHTLVLAMHHIVSDGWSMGVLLRELAALYAAVLAGKSSPLPKLAIQYADFAIWQREWLQGEILEGQLAYWRQRLAGHPPVLELPADRPRPAVLTFRGAVEPLLVGSGAAARLVEFGRRHGAPLFMTALAGFLALLHRYTGQADLLLVGTPTAGRNRVELEGLIGFFVNTLVLRNDASGDPAFVELLERVRETSLDAYAQGDLPFERLVEELAPERNLSHSPLFQVLFVVQTGSVMALPRIAGLETAAVELSFAAAKFDLMVALAETAEGIAGALEYNLDLLDTTTARRMAGHIANLLAGAAAHPEARLSELPLLAAAERDELLVEWNDTARLWESATPVHELFSAQARQQPAALAVAMGDRRLTYGEIEAGSARLARRLRALRVGPEVRVGICAERTPERVIAIVTVLKAGGVYVSLDPSYPRERLAYLLADARTAVLLTESRFLDRLPESPATVIAFDRPEAGEPFEDSTLEPPETGPESLAYVVYTSGSTGRPKGVAIPHRGLLNLVRWHCATYGLTAGDRRLTAYVAGFGESWPAEAELRELLEAEKGITQAFLPTPLAETLLEAVGERKAPAGLALRTLAIGGDRLHRAPRPGTPFALVNHYGPSEYSVVTTAAPIPAGLPGTPPIGRAIANTRIYALDAAGQLVPKGVTGKLYIGGEARARGYLGNPGLTAKKFVPDPWSAEGSGARPYRTGDLVRWLPDGSLDFLGRIDHQVKLRGMRVELGEIETVLARHSGVREAAVRVREDRPGDRRLTAYVAGFGESWPAEAELRELLEAELPAYMAPQDWLFLDALPLTANGKVARRALPAPDRRSETTVAPRTPMEELLAGIFCQVLGLPAVGIHDNFFALGGHSLLATQVVSCVRRDLGIDLEIRALFEEPTVEGLARRAENERFRTPGTAGTAAPPLRPAPRGEGARLPLSFAQQRLWFLDCLEPGSPLYDIPVMFRVEGSLDVAALAEIVRRHEALRTRFAQEGDEPVQWIAPPAARGTDADAEHALFLSLHLIVADGWSMGVLMHELAALYVAFSAGVAPGALASSLAEIADGLAVNNLAYVIYTSGSAGRAKGLAMPHGAIAQLVLDVGYLQLQTGNRLAQVDGAALDTTIFEIWGALLKGAPSVITYFRVVQPPPQLATGCEAQVCLGHSSRDFKENLRSMLVHGARLQPWEDEPTPSLFGEQAPSQRKSIMMDSSKVRFGTFNKIAKRWVRQLFGLSSHTMSTPLPSMLQETLFDLEARTLVSKFTRLKAPKRPPHKEADAEFSPAQIDRELYSLLFDHEKFAPGLSDGLQVSGWLAACLRGPGGLLPSPMRFDPSRLFLALQALPSDQSLQERSISGVWLEEVTTNCLLRKGSKSTPHITGELIWSPRERYNFYLNRFFSYDVLTEHGEGLSALGGFPQALGFAFKTVLEKIWHNKLRINVERGKESFYSVILDWVMGFANLHGCEVKLDATREFEALLVETRWKSIIYLKRGLNPERQAWGVCHELAHKTLAHIPNSRYGFDFKSLKMNNVKLYQRQEYAADALASLWIHLFTGLVNLAAELARNDHSARVLTNFASYLGRSKGNAHHQNCDASKSNAG